MNYKKIFVFDFIIILSLFLLDRISKILILNHSKIYPNFIIEVNSFLDFNLIWNNGIAFGLLAFEKNYLYHIISILIFLVIIFLYILSLREKTKKKYFYLLICGGAVGNLHDRISYGAVIDFIDLNYKNFHWFIFNVADIMITVGIFALILTEFFFKNENKIK